jgi:hypothetical protein
MINKKFAKAWKKLEDLEGTKKREDILLQISIMKKNWPSSDSNENISRDLSTTELKVKHIKDLISLSVEEYETIFDKTLDIAVASSLAQIDKNNRDKFWSSRVENAGMSAAEIIKASSVFQNKLSSIPESEPEFIKNLKQVDKLIWRQIAIEAKSWNMSKKDKEKMGIFGTAKAKTQHDWEWLKDQISDRVSKGVISENDQNGNIVDHHRELVNLINKLEA